MHQIEKYFYSAFLQSAMQNVDSARTWVLWLTGLPGSGKSTLAAALSKKLTEQGREVEWLDGDQLRSILPAIGFERQEREAYLRQVGFLAATLERHGITTIASFVSPYRESRQFIRGLCKNFVEIYVSTPLEECERRDPKGLYRKARAGEAKNFTGVSDPYELPAVPELTLDCSKLSPDDAVDFILDYLMMNAERS